MDAERDAFEYWLRNSRAVSYKEMARDEHGYMDHITAARWEAWSARAAQAARAAAHDDLTNLQQRYDKAREEVVRLRTGTLRAANALIALHAGKVDGGV